MIIIEWYLDDADRIRPVSRGRISVENLGFTDEEWRAMDETEKADYVKEVAWETLDLGWNEEMEWEEEEG